MNTITTTLITKAVFSDDGTKRYLLHKVWEAEKPSLAIIMLAPSNAAGIELDTTTQLVLNNASRLGYGSVAVLNLFAVLDDFSLSQKETEDVENIRTIVEMAETADTIIYAAVVGKAKNKAFQLRQKQVLTALIPFESKLNCLCSKDGNSRLQHPLSPAVRTWYLSPFRISEIIPEAESPKPEQKKKSK